MDALKQKTKQTYIQSTKHTKQQKDNRNEITV